MTADLTWYDSQWSQEETKRHFALVGRNPRVRYPGIDESFRPAGKIENRKNLKKYQLDPGYILVIGNGLPHKNLGVLLEIATQLKRKIVFVGVPKKNQHYWDSRFPNSRAIWMSHVKDDDLPSIVRGAFCLAQPSAAEGYGYPPLEAMACGIPAVVSKIPVLFETTGSMALFANPHKQKDWMEAFNALEDTMFCKDQVEKGLKWTERLLGLRAWDGYLSDIADVLEKK
jgi:glycosyltransferase involved in cell wall biosynthesis